MFCTWAKLRLNNLPGSQLSPHHRIKGPIYNLQWSLTIVRNQGIKPIYKLQQTSTIVRNQGTTTKSTTDLVRASPALWLFTLRSPHFYLSATLMSEQLENIWVAYLVLLDHIHLALRTQLGDVAWLSQQHDEALCLLEAAEQVCIFSQNMVCLGIPKQTKSSE